MISDVVMGMVSADWEGKHMAAWYAWSTWASLALNLSLFFLSWQLCYRRFSALWRAAEWSQMWANPPGRGGIMKNLMLYNHSFSWRCQFSREENSPYAWYSWFLSGYSSNSHCCVLRKRGSDPETKCYFLGQNSSVLLYDSQSYLNLSSSVLAGFIIQGEKYVPMPAIHTGLK